MFRTMKILLFFPILMYVISTAIFIAHAQISAQSCEIMNWVRRPERTQNVQVLTNYKPYRRFYTLFSFIIMAMLCKLLCHWATLTDNFFKSIVIQKLSKYTKAATPIL